MIVVDTNIISEMMKATANESVVAWLNQQDTSSLYLTTVTIAEIQYGLYVLPQGKRRRRLEDGFSRLHTEAFEGRVLDFDETAAHQYGKLMSYRKQEGHPMSVLDGQIASIASVHGFGVATRNVRDFEECGLLIINPFA